MNAKQLTNILVKIVGLDLCAHAVPTLAVALWIQLGDALRAGALPPVPVDLFTRPMAVPIVSVALGIFLILASRVVTNWLFESQPKEL